jgi:hypothetical protein
MCLADVHDDMVRSLYDKCAQFMPDAEAAAAEQNKTQRFRDNFLGTVKDNTSANLTASGRLEAQHEAWICVGCVAHAVNPLINEFANNHEGKNNDGERPAKRSEKYKQAKVRLEFKSVPEAQCVERDTACRCPGRRC